MKRKLIAVIFAVAAIAMTGCSTTGLKSSHTKGIGPVSTRLPYLNMVNYFGYVSPDVTPDGEYKGKDAYYLYFWVPAVIDEVGVSMYSPADKEPAEGDFQHGLYEELIAADSEAFFDTYLVLEKMSIIDPAKIKDGGEALSVLATNDDSSEMPKNPAGRKYNSLLRHVSEASDPLKALTRGVYRISFTSFRGSVEGSYLANVGTNVPGVIIASSLEELHDMVNAAE
ncbi:MAG: LipL32 family surface lipoprotein [Spirochaetales bacterium]|nr:LipL32 family surface lipoprotein [Spirochaetales bacterium]